MGENLDSKQRVPVKWVRDRAKAAYVKGPECYVCGTSMNLELHHLQSISMLLSHWIAKNKLQNANILDIRDEFISEHHREIYSEVYTLCKLHHMKLHGAFGQKPPLGSAPKQIRWLEIQKNKPPVTVNRISFSQFT